MITFRLLAVVTFALALWPVSATAVDKYAALKSCTEEARTAMSASDKKTTHDAFDDLIERLRMVNGDPVFKGTLMACMGKLGYYRAESRDCFPGTELKSKCWEPECACEPGDWVCNPRKGYLFCDN